MGNLISEEKLNRIINTVIVCLALFMPVSYLFIWSSDSCKVARAFVDENEIIASQLGEGSSTFVIPYFRDIAGLENDSTVEYYFLILGGEREANVSVELKEDNTGWHVDYALLMIPNEGGEDELIRLVEHKRTKPTVSCCIKSRAKELNVAIRHSMGVK